jgi:carboxyl-terminal processing protease
MGLIKKSFSSVYGFVALLMMLNLVLLGCKRKNPVVDEDKVVTTPDDKAPTTGTRDQLTKDSIFLYARQVYLWWDKLPTYEEFKPRNYPSFESELFAITRYGINPSTNKPYEFSPNQDGSDSNEPKYSSITDITTYNPIAYIPGRKSTVDLHGVGNDFGLLVKPIGVETAYAMYVQAVYPNSPAAKAGFKRGDRFTRLNNQNFGSNYNADYNFFYNALFNSSSVKIEGTTGTGTTFNRTLNKAVYNSSPIYKDSVYTSGSKKIGYFVYGRFSDENDSFPEFERVFSRFVQAGVTDLIVDLRYNGGGYVNTAENLINRIAPSTLNGRVMYSEYYNELMQQKKATILAKQPFLNSAGQPQYIGNRVMTYADVDYTVATRTSKFQKVGALTNLKSVVFIIGASTASASEMVINSLKPHMPVKVVGSTSYGKPVGFFPMRIDKYDVLFSMFEVKNSKGEGGYYSGITPDTGSSTADNDNSNYEFGDSRESAFAAAYNYIANGSFTSSSKSTSTISAKPMEALSSQGKDLADFEFKGMIQTPEDLIRAK